MRFVEWMIICGIVFGAPVGGFISNILEDENALTRVGIFVPLIIVAIFYIIACDILAKKDAERYKQARSIKNHQIHEKYATLAISSYEEYLNKSTDYYMADIFADNMNLGIACSIIDFVESEGQKLSLYSLHLFYSYIHDHWKDYENREISFYCFIPPYCPLSMTPLERSYFSYKYDTEIIKLLHYKESDFIDNEKYFIDRLSWQMETTYNGMINGVNSFSNNTFDIGFRVPDNFDYSIIHTENGSAVFVKVTGMITQDKTSNHMVIANCKIEKASYREYVSKLHDQFDDFKYSLPRCACR
jgi:hypothetical protein